MHVYVRDRKKKVKREKRERDNTEGRRKEKGRQKEGGSKAQTDKLTGISGRECDII